MKGRAGGWRERSTLYSLTGGPLQGLPVAGLPVPERAISSAVRALASHARGQRFKSFIAHHFTELFHLKARNRGPQHVLCAEVAIWQEEQGEHAATRAKVCSAIRREGS